MLQMEWETIRRTFVTTLEQRMSDEQFVYRNYVENDEVKT